MVSTEEKLRLKVMRPSSSAVSTVRDFDPNLGIGVEVTTAGAVILSCHLLPNI